MVIVNWNGGLLLRRCIASVIASPPQSHYEVLVVDNGSTDGSPEWLHELLAADEFGPRGRCRLLENPNNLGFSRANNQALGATDAPLLFLLNADAELRPGALDALIATAESDARIGACAPRVINPDGSVQPNVARNPLTAWEILLSGLRLEWLLPPGMRSNLLLREHWKHDRRRFVPFASCTALLVKRRMVSEVGGLDERFDMYAEDVEWALRMRRSGWLIAFEPSAEVLHHKHAFARRRWTDAERQRIGLKAELLGWEISLGRWHGIANSLASSLILALAAIRRRLRGQSSTDVQILLGLHRAFIRRRLGAARRGGTDI